MLERIINKLRSEPVRVRLYAILTTLATYALIKGYVEANDLDFLLTIAALILGVERARSKVKPVAKSE